VGNKDEEGLLGNQEVADSPKVGLELELTSYREQVALEDMVRILDDQVVEDWFH
jgi:hypothetical protein